MMKENDCGNNVSNNHSGFLIIVVLYILIAIILGSRSGNMYY